MHFLTTADEFDNLQHHFQKARPSFIAIDTEFHRQTTFYPELSLIQMAWEGECFIVDALSHAWHPQYTHPLLFSDFLTLVMHASRQDLEIFFQLYHTLPTFIFDTQTAATFLGFGDNCSYRTLVEHYLGITLDKSQQHTAWMQRPLSYEQITYAAHDVLHLFDIYPLMVSDLKKQDRFEWALQDMASLSSLRFNEPIQPSQLVRMGIAKKNYFVALSLFNWRDEQARTLNYNRGRIISDNHLVTLCAFRDLGRVRDYCMRHHLLENHSLLTIFLEYFEYLLKTDVDSILPNPISFTLSQQEKIQSIKHYRDEKAEQLNMPASFLASSEDIKNWVRSHDGRLATTWRHAILADAL